MKLTIGSYNIAATSKAGYRSELIAADILEQKPDIVGLQEVDRFATRSHYHDIMKELSEETGYPYFFFAHAIDLGGDEATYGQKGEYGLGILSKYPMLSTDSMPLYSGTREQRILAHAEIDVNGTRVHFFNTHLSFEEEAIRTRQLEIVREHIADYENCILTGDFNVRLLTELEALSCVRVTVDESNPLTTFIPNVGAVGTKSIDNICFSDAFSLEESGVYDQGHSDHKMLIAKLSYCPKQ